MLAGSFLRVLSGCRKLTDRCVCDRVTLLGNTGNGRNRHSRVLCV